MKKEVVISASHDSKSLARLTRLKWLVAALLFVALALGWMARKPVRTTGVTDSIDFGAAAAGSQSSSPAPASAVPGASSAAQAPAATATPSASASHAQSATGPRLVLERRVDGQLTVRGQVADPGVRDQWLNAIRIGAQGSRVESELDVADVGSAASWETRLRQLTALVGDRKLSRVELQGNRLSIEGPAVAASYRRETERLFLAQLSDGFQVQYRTVNPSTGGPRGTTAASTAPAVSSVASVQAPDPSSASSATPASAPLTPAPSAAPLPAPSSAPIREAQPRPQPGDGAAQRLEGCPAQLASLSDSIYFRTDSVGIGRQDRARLATLGRCMGNRRISVIGFADSRHTSQYNLELSMRRAQAVADLIRSEAPRGAVIRVSAQGAERGKSRADAERSRRVEIRLQ